jgi:hypothetical protein
MAALLNYFFLQRLDALRVTVPGFSPWSVLVVIASNALRLGGEIFVFVWMSIAVASALLVAAGFLA